MSVRKSFCWVPVLLLVFAAAASAQSLRVNADRTVLRDRPSTDGAAVASLVKGDELTVVERDGMWYRARVAASGAEGYVYGLLVDVVGTAATPAPPTPAARTSAAAPPVSVPSTPVSQGTSSSSSASAPERQYLIRTFGGLLTGYGDAGFAVGGGVGLHPLDNEQLEVTVDGLYGHTAQAYFVDSYSTSVLAFSGNLLYNFQPPGSGMYPFVGGGLLVSHASVKASVLDLEAVLSGTFTSLQFVGGIEKPLNDRRAFRAEIRTGVASFGGSVLLLAGISF